MGKSFISLLRPFVWAKGWSGYQWIMLLLMSAAMMVGFIDRVNLSVVVPVWIANGSLSPVQAGFVLSIFSWVYAVGSFFAGPVIARFHQKYVLPLGMVLWTVATWLPALTLSMPLLTFARSLLGLGEATLIPSNTRIASELFGRGDQAKAVGALFAAGQVGLVVGTPLATLLLSHLGWQAVFVVTGALSFLWLVLWVPIYQPEKGVISEKKGVPEETEPARTRWLSLLSYRQIWGLLLGQCGALYLLYLLITWLPGILALQEHLSIVSAGWFSSLLFLTCVLVILVSGWGADFWLRHGGEVTLVRKTFCGGGMGLSTLSLVLAACTHHPILLQAMLLLAISGFAMTVPSAGVLPMELVSRKMLATLSGLHVFFGSLGSATAPLLTGWLYGWTGSFQVALLAASAITLILGVGGFGWVLSKVECLANEQ